MQIILLEKVVNLGSLGDIVTVKDGYARNFLVPQGKARRATKIALAEFEAKRKELEKIASEKLKEAQVLAEKLTNYVVKITQKSGVDGRLFGSVTNHDIAEVLNNDGFTEIKKQQIRMKNGIIKTVSSTTVELVLHTDVVVDLVVDVLAENN